ncbi:LysR substrate-binding domain-containing protein [Pelagibius sp. Alg239-R121]|uniref:LysR substrate-binding domain-containing protein n=1 Tax=Pelagibius sp. Alg239-R121 TaxID=2993448 RepID=UPI0024A7595B|nr:LysR substrate-binding domain-containing protein [Pelagibius sp. Alg239-R121]
MNQRQIEVFRAVMIYGSITRAAEMLRVSQPAVSRLIADLESDLGFQLFVRSGGRAQPTPEAASLKEEADRFFIGLDRVEAAAREIRDLRRGHIRLATMPAVSFAIAPRIVSAFTKTNESVKVTMDVHTSPRIIDLLAAGQFDLGLAQLPETRPDIEILATYRLACVCAVPTAHPLAGKTEISIEDLAGEPLVALSHHTLASRHLAQSFLAADIRRDIKVESQPSYAACALVAEGVGLAIVDPLTADFFGRERLAVAAFVPETPFDIRLMRPAGVPVSRLTEVFAEQAMNRFAEHPLVTQIT